MRKNMTDQILLGVEELDHRIAPGWRIYVGW